MEGRSPADICDEFLRFHFYLKCWLNEHYMRKFNINGKGKYRVTQRQFEILMLLKHLNDGSNTLSDLEEKLHISSSSLSTTVGKMVQQGYIARSYPPDEEDRRKTYLHITEKGEKVIRDLHDRIKEGFFYFYETLTDEQKQSFTEGVDKLVKIFENE